MIGTGTGTETAATTAQRREEIAEAVVVRGKEFPEGEEEEEQQQEVRAGINPVWRMLIRTS